MNSTETPGGSGIPAGWYDDPSGQGLRWWDGEQWTEHVHTAGSAAAAAGEGGGGDREAPPPELVKLRERIRARGAKTVGMFLGGVVLVIVVLALLLSGGSEDNNGGSEPGGTTPPSGQVTKQQKKLEIKAINQQLKNKKLPKAARKELEAQKKKLEKGGSGKKDKNGKKSGGSKQKTPGEEGG